MYSIWNDLQCNGKYRYLECIDQGLIIELLLNNKNKINFPFCE